MPEVSVVIPTHNRAEFLRPAIQSVLAQTYQDFEIIIIDDGSTDNTQNVVRNFHDQRIKYVRYETNRGEALSRNAGILRSEGKYIAFLDDDDEWFPEILEMQVKAMENGHSDIGLVYTGRFIVDQATDRILSQEIPQKRGDVYQDLLRENFVGATSVVLLKREVIERVGLFDPNIAYGLDFDLWIRISKHSHFEYIKEPLVKYRFHKSRLSNDLKTVSRGVADMRKKYGRKFILNNNYFKSRYGIIGIKFCDMGNMKNGRKAFLSSIMLNPFDIRAYFYLGLSLFGAGNFARLRRLGRTLLSYSRPTGFGRKR